MLSFFEEIKTIATILHVFSVIMGMGSAYVSDILFSFYSKDRRLDQGEITTLRILSHTTIISLCMIVLSGCAIFLSDPDAYLASSKFIVKMCVIGVICLNGFLLHRFIFPHMLKKGFLQYQKHAGLRRLSFVFGAVSVTSWAIAFVLGMLNSLPYSVGAILLLYVAILSVAICTALAAEYYTFRRK